MFVELARPGKPPRTVNLSRVITARPATFGRDVLIVTLASRFGLWRGRRVRWASNLTLKLDGTLRRRFAAACRRSIRAGTSHLVEISREFFLNAARIVTVTPILNDWADAAEIELDELQVNRAGRTRYVAPSVLKLGHERWAVLHTALERFGRLPAPDDTPPLRLEAARPARVQ